MQFVLCVLRQTHVVQRVYYNLSRDVRVRFAFFLLTTHLLRSTATDQIHSGLMRDVHGRNDPARRRKPELCFVENFPHNGSPIYAIPKYCVPYGCAGSDSAGSINIFSFRCKSNFDRVLHGEARTLCGQTSDEITRGEQYNTAMLAPGIHVALQVIRTRMAKYITE